MTEGGYIFATIGVVLFVILLGLVIYIVYLDKHVSPQPTPSVSNIVPHFSATNPNAFPLTSNTPKKIDNWGTQTAPFYTDGTFDVNKGEFTASKTAKYMISATVPFYTAIGEFSAMIVLNGNNNILTFTTSNISTTYATINDTVLLNKGDVLSLVAVFVGTKATVQSCKFSISRIDS